jgi:hypothetical protein
MMVKRLYVLSIAGLLALCLSGCGEKPDVEKDHLDPQSLKILENPPPGVPGPPPGVKPVGGNPASQPSPTTPPAPAGSGQ